jgi:hypothetical protein
MKMTDKEKRFIGLFQKLESEKTREDLICQAEAMVRAQEALKADYGLVGLDAPLFNSSRQRPGPSNPAYSMPGPAPMGAAELAQEALNG